MSIRTRLHLLLLAVLTAVVLVVFTTVRSKWQTDRHLERLEMVQSLAARSTALVNLTDQFLNHGEVRHRTAWRRNFSVLKQEMNACQLTGWRNGVLQAMSSIEQAFELVEEVRSSPSAYPDPVLRARLLDRAASRITADVQLLLSAARHEVSQAVLDIRAGQRAQMHELFVVVLSLLVFTAISVYWVQRSFMASLKELLKGTSAITAGDLSARVQVAGNDEHAELAARFNAMAAQLEGTMGAERELRRELQSNSAELARSNADLERFASLASHDLKEPLRMIGSFMQLLERNYGGVLDEKALQYIHFAVDGSTRMARLIEALLEYSKLGRSKHAMGPVRTHALMEEVKGFVAAELSGTQGSLTWDELPVVMGAAVPLRLVFQNLVANALKYHRPGVPPEVHVTASATATHWEFTVRDNGMGIQRADAERIFAPFKRLPGSIHQGGIGMGLAICKRIVEQHGGKIQVISEPGQGSSFVFTLAREGSPGAWGVDRSA